MGSLADLYVTIRPDLSKFGSELKAGFHPIGIRAGGELGDGIKRALGHGLIAVGVAAGAALGGALTKGFGRLSAIENATAKLTGLGHSAKDVSKIMVSALASVKGTAFGLDEAATVAATAVASGIKPGQELRRTLGLVADAATIGGTSLGEMGAIFAKVAASNKIQGGTINQLNDRGIPILKLLGDVMHKSQGEVSKLASRGKVDFATFQKAMEQGLGGAALKSGDTATGAFKNMGAAFSRVGAALLKGVFPQIGGGFRTVTKWLDSITPAAERFGKSFGKVLSKVGDLLGNVFAGRWAKAGAQLQGWGDKVVGWIQNTATPWIWGKLKLLGAGLVAWIGPRIKPTLEKLGEWIRAAAAWIRDTAAPWVWKHLQILGAKLEAWIKPRIPGMLAKLGEFANKIVDWISNKGLPMLGKFMGKMGAKLEAWILPRIPGMILNLIKLGGAIQTWILFKAIPMLLGGAAKMAGNMITGFYNEAKRLDLPGKIRGVISDMWNRAKTRLQDVVDGFKAKGKAILQGLKDGIVEKMGKIGNWIKTNIGDPIVSAVKSFFGIKSPSTVMADVGRNLILGLGKGLLSISPISLIKKVFGGMPEALGALVNKGLASIQGLPSKALSALSGLGGKFAGLIGGASNVVFGNLPTGGNRVIGRAMAAAYGWTGGQWNALNALWTGESGWNNRARNPSSGAFGIPQALPPGKMGAAAAGGNAAAQIAWGLGYIKSVYGSPANAYSRWLGRSPHWYGKGTDNARPGPAIVGEHGPEAVWMRGGEQVIPLTRPSYARIGGGGTTVNHYHYTVNAPNYVGPERELIKVLVDANRRGQLQVIKDR